MYLEMDAHALLTSQGWRGSGHSLHPTDDAQGLSRPLLVSQKQNVLGIGKKQHHTSDMWWMNAFDKSLKGLDTSKEGHVVQTVNNGALDMVAKGGSKFIGSGGLYSCFVRGESLVGTMQTLEGTRNEERSPRKKKSNKHNGETKEERRARKAAKRAQKAEKLDIAMTTTPPASSVPKVNTGSTKVEESKEQRKERRRQKKALREESKKG